MLAIVKDKIDPLCGSVVKVTGINHDHLECIILISSNEKWKKNEGELFLPEQLTTDFNKNSRDPRP